MYSSFARWAWQCFTKYYNLKLGSDCNLGKNLSRNRELSQLVKHKDTREYLQLYISIDHKVYMLCIYGKWIIKHEENIKETMSTTWDANWDNFGIVDHCIMKKLP